MRASTILCCAFLLAVVVPLSWLGADLSADWWGISPLWFRGFFLLLLVGLVDTLLHVDELIRRNIAVTQSSPD